MIRIYALILIFISTTDLFAQLTPAQYRAEVVEYSLTLKSAEQTLISSEQTLAYTKTSQLPKLSASGSFNYHFRQYDDQKSWSMYVEPQLIQTIYGGGTIRANVNKAKVESEIALCTADFTLLEVLYAADYAYWNYWAMRRYSLVMAQYIELIEVQSRAIDRRYQEGYISKGDLLMMTSRLREAEYELIASQKSQLEAQHNLNILRGVAPTDSIQISSAVTNGADIPQRVAISQVIEQRPDYIAAKLNEDAAALYTKSIRGGYYPQLKGGVSGSLRSLTPNYSGSTELNGALFVQLTVPIYYFGEGRKAVAVAKTNEVQMAINSATVIDDIVSEESTAWSNLILSREQMVNAQSSLEIASENLDISTYSYNEGLVSILDLMQAQISWIQIYKNTISAEYNYQIALATYRKSVGIVEYDL